MVAHTPEVMVTHQSAPKNAQVRLLAKGKTQILSRTSFGVRRARMVKMAAATTRCIPSGTPGCGFTFDFGVSMAFKFHPGLGMGSAIARADSDVCCLQNLSDCDCDFSRWLVLEILAGGVGVGGK